MALSDKIEAGHRNASQEDGSKSDQQPQRAKQSPFTKMFFSISHMGILQKAGVGLVTAVAYEYAAFSESIIVSCNHLVTTQRKRYHELNTQEIQTWRHQDIKAWPGFKSGPNGGHSPNSADPTSIVGVFQQGGLGFVVV